MASNHKRWNHSAVALKGHFNWKMMIIGGCTESKLATCRRGNYVSDITTFDVAEHGIWSKLMVNGECPVARDKTAVVLDDKENRVVVFGGWADNWLGDLHVLKYGNAMDKEQVANRMLLNDNDRSILTQYAKRHEKEGHIQFHVVEDYLCTGHGKNAHPVFKWPFLTKELDSMVISAHRHASNKELLTTEEFMTLFETMKIFDNIDSRHTGQIAFDSYAEFIFSGTLFKWPFETEVYEAFMQTLSSSDPTGEGRLDFETFVRMMVMMRQVKAADPKFTGTFDSEGIKGLVNTLDLSSSQFEGLLALVESEADNASINAFDLLCNLHRYRFKEDKPAAKAKEPEKAGETGPEPAEGEEGGDAAEEGGEAEEDEAAPEAEEAKTDDTSAEGAEEDEAGADKPPPNDPEESEKGTDSAFATELRAVYVAALEAKQRRAEERAVIKKENTAATKVQALARGRAARKAKEDEAEPEAPAEDEAAEGDAAEGDAAEGDAAEGEAAEGEAKAEEGETGGEAKAEEGDAKAEEGEAKAEEGEAKAEEGEAKAEEGAAEGEAKADEGEAKAEEGEAKAEEGEAKAEEGEAKADEGEAKADEGEAKAEEGEAKAEEGEAKAEEGEAKAEAKPEEGEAKPEEGEAKADEGEAKADEGEAAAEGEAPADAAETAEGEAADKTEADGGDAKPADAEAPADDAATS